MFDLKSLSRVIAALSLSMAAAAHAQSANPEFAVSVDPNEVTGDDASFIIETLTHNQYQHSVWSGMHSHEVGDFNGDKHDDFIALVKSAKDDTSKNPPTHLMIVLGDASGIPFEKVKDYSLVELNEGTPADFPEAFVAVEKKERAKTFATIGCDSERAIEMIEEASTAFYLCWNNGKFEFMRDPEDIP